MEISYGNYRLITIFLSIVVFNNKFIFSIRNRWNIRGPIHHSVSSMLVRPYIHSSILKIQKCFSYVRSEPCDGSSEIGRFLVGVQRTGNGREIRILKKHPWEKYNISSPIAMLQNKYQFTSFAANSFQLVVAGLLPATGPSGRRFLDRPIPVRRFSFFFNLAGEFMALFYGESTLSETANRLIGP